MKRMLTVTLTLIIALLVTATPAIAEKPVKLNFGKELNAAACDGGTLVVNVTQQVVNSLDSAESRPVWAFVDYNLHIRIWQTGANTFCAIVKSEGQFTAIEGASPGDTADATIDAGVSGPFAGGYRTPQFTATFNPQAATHGHLGTLDPQCDPSVPACERSIHDWVSRYFPSLGGIRDVGLDWWGWIYHGGGNGTWANSIEGSEGDIIS